jgi:hypothetical protein
MPAPTPPESATIPPADDRVSYYNRELCAASFYKCNRENQWNMYFCYFDVSNVSLAPSALKNYFPPYRFAADLGDGSIGSTSWDVDGWTYTLSDAAFKGFGTGQYVARACASHPTTMDSYYLYTPNQVFSSQVTSGAVWDLQVTPIFSSLEPYDYTGPCRLAGTLYSGLWISLQLPYPVVVNRMSFTSLSSGTYPAGYKVYCKAQQQQATPSQWRLLFDNSNCPVSYVPCTRAQCGDEYYSMIVHDSGCFNNTLFACSDVAFVVGRRGGPIPTRDFEFGNLRFYNYTDEAALMNVLYPPLLTPAPTPAPTPAEPYSYSGPVLCDRGALVCSSASHAGSLSYWCAFGVRQYPPYAIPAASNPMSESGSNGREQWETVGWSYMLDGRAGHGPAGQYTVRACSDYVMYDMWDRYLFLLSSAFAILTMTLDT